MYIFDNTVKNHDAKLCDIFFESELVHLNTAKKTCI